MSLTPTSKWPLYQQLADSFAEAIHQGTLKPGKRLPAIRRVARGVGQRQYGTECLAIAWKIAG